MSFLVKKNRTYHLQVKVPAKLTDTLGSGDLSISLGTGSKRKAGKLAELASMRYQLAFSRIKHEGAGMDTLKIKQVVREFVKQGLEDFEIDQALGKPNGNHGTLDDDLEALDVDLDQSRMALGMRRHAESMGHKLPIACQQLNLEPPPTGSPAYLMLTREMLKGHIRMIEAHTSRLLGQQQGHDLGSVLKDLGLSDPLLEAAPAETPATGQPTVTMESPPLPSSLPPDSGLLSS